MEYHLNSNLNLSRFIFLISIFFLTGCQAILNSYAEATYDPDEYSPLTGEGAESMYSIYSVNTCKDLSEAFDENNTRKMADYAALIQRVMTEKKCDMRLLDKGNFSASGKTSSTNKNNLSESRKTGPAQSGYIGVCIAPVTSRVAAVYGLSKEVGAFVIETIPGSAAAKAGIRSGDVILDISGEKVNHPDDLLRIVSRLPSGKIVTLGIWRDRKPQDIPVTISSESPAR